MRLNLLNNWCDVPCEWRQRAFWINVENNWTWRSLTIAGFTIVWWRR